MRIFLPELPYFLENAVTSSCVTAFFAAFSPNLTALKLKISNFWLPNYSRIFLKLWIRRIFWREFTEFNSLDPLNHTSKKFQCSYWRLRVNLEPCHFKLHDTLFFFWTLFAGVWTYREQWTFWSCSAIEKNSSKWNRDPSNSESQSYPSYFCHDILTVRSHP